MATVEVKCRFCQQTESVRKHGSDQGEHPGYHKNLWGTLLNRR